MPSKNRRRPRSAARPAQRALCDLVSVGPATIGDLRLLGITRVAELRGRRADTLYRRLCTVTGIRHDPCCQDVFAAAIAQADNPRLPVGQRKWWYWSRIRRAKAQGRRD